MVVSQTENLEDNVNRGIKEQEKTVLGPQEETTPLIVTARPGLADSESALMRRLPSNYADKSVRDVLAYVVDSQVKDNEAATAASLKKELGAAGSVIVINGQNAKLTDKVSQYVINAHKDVAGKKINYQQLEIEVSAVQQGGYRI